MSAYQYGWNDPRTPYDIAMDKKVEPPDMTVRKILSGEIAPEDRKGAIIAVIRRDQYLADARRMYMATPMHMVTDTICDDNIYRVSVFPDGIDIVCFGLSSIDSPIDGHYDRTDDLPNWVKERLAVLMITSGTPPTQEVAGVGRRISSHVYWVYAPETTS